MYDVLPLYWNCAIVADEEIISFMWGFFEPLEKFLHVIRISTDKHYRGEEVRMLSIDCLKALKDDLGALNVFFISDYADMFVENYKGKLKLSNGKVVEVVRHENLH